MNNNVNEVVENKEQLIKLITRTKYKLNKMNKAVSDNDVANVEFWFSSLVDTYSALVNFDLKLETEQLYYVQSLISNTRVLNEELGFMTNPFSFLDDVEENEMYKTRFTQSGLDSLQGKLPGLNIEKLKVRVEEYDNEHA